MTFDDWWKQFLEIYGKPKDPAQLKPSRAFALVAWTAGRVEGFSEADRVATRLKQHREE